VHVVYEGFDPQLFKPAPSGRDADAQPFLLYAETLDPHKNIPFLRGIYAKLRSQIDRLGLTLVGRYEAHAADALIQTVPEVIRRDVRFMGFVSDPDLAALMQNCAAFVFPSRNEGFGLAPVEAMACGAPVVAAAAGSLPEIIAEGGVLLSPDDDDSWVAELTRILSNDAHRRERSEKTIARSGVFSWDEAARAFRRIVAPDRLPGPQCEASNALM